MSLLDLPLGLLPVERTREERRALELWCLYHVETERFDRAVCLCADYRGIAIPTTRSEQNACARYAFLTMRKIFDRAVAEKIPGVVMNRARLDASCLRWAEIVAIAERAPKGS